MQSLALNIRAAADTGSAQRTTHHQATPWALAIRLNQAV
jgi:hypothetical protein